MAICEAAGPSGSVCSVTAVVSVFGSPFSSRTGLPSASFTGVVTEVDCSSGTVR